MMITISTAFNYGLAIGLIGGAFLVAPCIRFIRSTMVNRSDYTDTEREIVDRYLDRLPDNCLSTLYHHIKYGSSEVSLTNMIGERNFIILKSGEVGKLIYRNPEYIKQRLVNHF